MRAQVAEGFKALHSVRALVKNRHIVVFGDGEDGYEHYIINRDT